MDELSIQLIYSSGGGVLKIMINSYSKSYTTKISSTALLTLLLLSGVSVFTILPVSSVHAATGAGTLSLSASSGPPNYFCAYFCAFSDTVTITGTGFPDDQGGITLRFAPTSAGVTTGAGFDLGALGNLNTPSLSRTATTVMADANGYFQVKFKVPLVTGGQYNVFATYSQSFGGLVPTAAQGFTVTSAIQVNSFDTGGSSGIFGDPLEVAGVGFASGDTIQLGQTNSFFDSGVAPSVTASVSAPSGLNGGTFEVNPTGAVTGIVNTGAGFFEVGDIPGGAITVSATGSTSLCGSSNNVVCAATTAFQVNPSLQFLTGPVTPLLVTPTISMYQGDTLNPGTVWITGHGFTPSNLVANPGSVVFVSQQTLTSTSTTHSALVTNSKGTFPPTQVSANNVLTVGPQTVEIGTQLFNFENSNVVQANPYLGGSWFTPAPGGYPAGDTIVAAPGFGGISPCIAAFGCSGFVFGSLEGELIASHQAAVTGSGSTLNDISQANEYSTTTLHFQGNVGDAVAMFGYNLARDSAVVAYSYNCGPPAANCGTAAPGVINIGPASGNSLNPTGQTVAFGVPTLGNPSGASCVLATCNNGVIATDDNGVFAYIFFTPHSQHLSNTFALCATAVPACSGGWNIVGPTPTQIFFVNPAVHAIGSVGDGTGPVAFVGTGFTQESLTVNIDSSTLWQTLVGCVNAAGDTTCTLPTLGTPGFPDVAGGSHSVTFAGAVPGNNAISSITVKTTILNDQFQVAVNPTGTACGPVGVQPAFADSLTWSGCGIPGFVGVTPGTSIQLLSYVDPTGFARGIHGLLPSTSYNIMLDTNINVGTFVSTPTGTVPTGTQFMLPPGTAGLHVVDLVPASSTTSAVWGKQLFTALGVPNALITGAQARNAAGDQFWGVEIPEIALLPTSPPNGYVGSTTGISGAGLPPSTTLYIKWLGLVVGSFVSNADGTIPSGVTTAAIPPTATGGVCGAFFCPAPELGTPILFTITDSTGVVWATAPWILQAQMTLSKSSGSAGDIVSVSATGLIAVAAYNIVWNYASGGTTSTYTGSIVGAITTNGVGSASSSFTVPSNASPGTYTVGLVVIADGGAQTAGSKALVTPPTFHVGGTGVGTSTLTPGSPSQTTLAGNPAVSITYTNTLTASTTAIAYAVVTNSQGQIVYYTTSSMTFAASGSQTAYLVIAGLPHGTYTVTVFAISSNNIGFSTSSTATVTV